VLYVLRFLIAYTFHIAAAVEEYAASGDLAPVAISFAPGITFQALVTRLARGLRRALALQEMLQQRAATGQDIDPVPPRRSGPGGGSRKNNENQDRPPEPERLPSAAEIAAELQRRPVGAIVAEICHDIGIAPEDLTEEQWDALQAVIDTYGGSREKLWPSMRNRIVARFAAIAADPEHAEIPHIPLVPWDRPARIAAQYRTRPPP
jgi:hypothetical protein